MSGLLYINREKKGYIRIPSIPYVCLGSICIIPYSRNSPIASRTLEKSFSVVAQAWCLYGASCFVGSLQQIETCAGIADMSKSSSPLHVLGRIATSGREIVVVPRNIQAKLRVCVSFIIRVR